MKRYTVPRVAHCGGGGIVGLTDRFRRSEGQVDENGKIRRTGDSHKGEKPPPPGGWYRGRTAGNTKPPPPK